MKVFTLTTGRTALYLAFLGLAFPSNAIAGGLDKGVKVDKHGGAGGRLRAPETAPSKQQLRPVPPLQDRLMRPSFDQPDTKTKTMQEAQEAREATNEKGGSDAPARTATPTARAYTKTIGAMIADNNIKGRRTGHIKLYAKQGTWGPGVKIQACFGDNVLTKFTVADKGASGSLRFQVQVVPTNKSKSAGNKWVPVSPGKLIRGRYIYLRAQSVRQSDVITLSTVGICIDRPAAR